MDNRQHWISLYDAVTDIDRDMLARFAAECAKDNPRKLGRSKPIFVLTSKVFNADCYRPSARPILLMIRGGVAS